MRYWLMKSEPDEFSIDDLVRAPAQTTSWFGVRNYQARNFMRDMKLGEFALFYHSSCPEPGIAGIVEIAKLAHPGRIAVRHEEPVLRSEVDARRPALVERRRQARAQDAARVARRDARSARAVDHGHAAQGQPAVHHAGHARRVEGVSETVANEFRAAAGLSRARRVRSDFSRDSSASAVASPPFRCCSRSFRVKASRPSTWCRWRSARPPPRSCSRACPRRARITPGARCCGRSSRALAPGIVVGSLVGPQIASNLAARADGRGVRRIHLVRRLPHVAQQAAGGVTAAARQGRAWPAWAPSSA